MTKKVDQNLLVETDNVVITVASELKGNDSWVQIFPGEKEWYGNDGRRPYRLSEPLAVIERSKAKSHLEYAMVCRDHARELAAPGTPVKAAGWFKDYQIREDGSVWGEVNWTETASKEIKSKEYRYFSATFVVDKESREVLAIRGGTITNTPNFRGMQALASEKVQPNQKDVTMKDYIIALAKKLGLDPEKSSEEEVIAAASKHLDNAEQAQTDIASFRKALGAAENAANAEVIETATSKMAKADNFKAEDFVPRQTYEELASEHKTLKATTEKSKAVELVESAMKDGKITPAQKAWATELASSNPQSFEDFIKNAPSLAGEEELAGDQGQGQAQHSKEDLEVAAQLGLDAEDLKD